MVLFSALAVLVASLPVEDVDLAFGIAGGDGSVNSDYGFEISLFK
jgi:hypothetical protein